jgi:para-aminobenzoate synthetase
MRGVVDTQPNGSDMRTLLIDNHDSYTYNLFQLIAVVYGVPPVVLTNDSADWESVDLSEIEAIVISPGPGRPQVARDVGVLVDVVPAAHLPVLGVCLGHQALAWLCGADVVPAPTPRHGHLERVRHVARDLFTGLPQGFTAVRYHSLCVATPLPAILKALAWAEDGVIMGLRHVDLPWWGVQFHPESVATEHGVRLLENFRQLAHAAGGLSRPAGRTGTAHGGLGPSQRQAQVALRTSLPPASFRPASRWSVRFQCLDWLVDHNAAFAKLFLDHPYAFWLDSSRAEPGLSRFSFLGSAGGPYGEVLTYRVGSPGVEVRNGSGTRLWAAGSIFDVLDERLRSRAVPAPPLPFDLACGYAGYLGYELKADCGSPNRHVSPVPDAIWMAATRLVALDHDQRRTWLVALCGDGPGAAAEAERWMREAACRLAQADGDDPDLTQVDRVVAPLGGVEFDPEPWLARPREAYLANVEECLRELRAGESYEICLTTRVEIPFYGCPIELYHRQRLLNPAPYAAYLRLGDLHVLCSSPERFLKVSSDRYAESKPIKGTAPRHPDPARDAALRAELAASSKNRAENLMIVDLLRNDLGRVCEVGTVVVPRLMTVESYATVHQLVSTIRGRLRDGVSAVSAARACFPGGSMTGAPKLRTMEIIDRLEQGARGIYSGAIGYFGLPGTAELNIAIRTAVAHDGLLIVGAGGAIVLDSDPAAEYDEMLLKARAPLRALTGSSGD